MSWDTAKRQVDELPNDWYVVASSYEKSESYRIKNDNFGKYKRTTIKMKPIEGFTTQLISYKDKDGVIKESFYAMFNEKDGIMHRRDIS